MRRAVLSVAIANVFLLGLSARSAAQVAVAAQHGVPFVQPIGFHHDAKPYRPPSGDTTRSRIKDDDHFRPWPWFIGGALVGGVGLGGLAAYEVSACATSDSCMFAGQYVLIAAGVGALGGGLITLFVYSLIRGGS